jgi:hypothetical protein
MFDDIEESPSISLKEIFEKIKYYLRDLFSKWYLIVIFGLVGAGCLWYYAASSEAHYEADLSFIVKNAGNSGGGIEGVLSQMGWGGVKTNTNLEKVKTILFSKSVLTEALYDSAMVNEKKDLLANHIASLYGYSKVWKNSTNLNSFDKFRIENKYDDSQIIQNYAFSKVLSLVRGGDKKGNILTVTSESGIDLLSLNVRTIDEQLSYALSMSVFSHLNDFYLDNETSNTKSAIQSLEAEADSVGRLLRQKEYQLATARDRNYGIILSKNQVNQDEVQRDIQVLTAVYAQMRQNLEMSQFGLKNSGSKFEVLEHPVLPLSKKIKAPLNYSLIGLAIGVSFILLFLILRRFLLDELK